MSELKKQLKQGLFMFVGGKHVGEPLITIKNNSSTIQALHLIPGNNFNETYKMEEFKELLDDEFLEFVENIPDDIFSNFKNTWKNNR